MTTEKFPPVSIEEYNQLVDDSLMLEALMRVGVNNWEGYEEALLIYDELVETEEEI